MRQRTLFISIFSRKTVTEKKRENNSMSTGLHSAGVVEVKGWPKPELAQNPEVWSRHEIAARGKTHQLNKGNWNIWGAGLEDFWETYCDKCWVKPSECPFEKVSSRNRCYLSVPKDNEESSSKVHPCCCLYIGVCVCVYIYVCVHICVYTCVHIHVCIHVCTCVYAYVYIRVYIYVCLYTYMCVCMYTYMLIYICASILARKRPQIWFLAF